jgi:hypothetical protein
MCVKPILLQDVPVDYPLGISASNIFEGFPEVKKDLWGRRIFGGWMFC